MRGPPSLCSRRPTHLSEEGDGLLAHGLGVPDVGTDDLGERLFDTLSREEATTGYSRHPQTRKQEAKH